MLQIEDRKMGQLPLFKFAKQKFMNLRSIRFKHDTKTYALIDIHPTNNNFHPSLTALVLDESYNGCGLIIRASSDLQSGNVCRIKVGELSPLNAKIVWIKNVENGFKKMGLKFLD